MTKLKVLTRINMFALEYDYNKCADRNNNDWNWCEVSGKISRVWIILHIFMSNSCSLFDCSVINVTGSVDGSVSRIISFKKTLNRIVSYIRNVIEKKMTILPFVLKRHRKKSKISTVIWPDTITSESSRLSLVGHRNHTIS